VARAWHEPSFFSLPLRKAVAFLRSLPEGRERGCAASVELCTWIHAPVRLRLPPPRQRQTVRQFFDLQKLVTLCSNQQQLSSKIKRVTPLLYEMAKPFVDTLKRKFHCRTVCRQRGGGPSAHRLLFTLISFIFLFSFTKFPRFSCRYQKKSLSLQQRQTEFTSRFLFSTSQRKNALRNWTNGFICLRIWKT